MGVSAVAIPGLDPAAYQPHALHGDACAWPETNCYVDLWIGVLHALRLDPIAMLPFCFGADFEGDQWTFLKPSLDDLWTLYGIEVQELNVWDGLSAHVPEQVSRGRLPLVEVDSFYLPDTQGTAYRREHTKTTIGVNALDLDAEQPGLFPQRRLLTLWKGKTCAAFCGSGRRRAATACCLMPSSPNWTAASPCRRTGCGKRRSPSRGVTWTASPAEPAEQVPRAACRSRPRNQPADSVGYYHRYAFATVRQLGAAFQMAAAYAALAGSAAPVRPVRCGRRV